MTKQKISAALKTVGSIEVNGFILAYDGNQELNQGGSGFVWTISSNGDFLNEFRNKAKAVAAFMEVAS